MLLTCLATSIGLGVGGWALQLCGLKNLSTLETVLVRVGRAINVVDPNNLQLR